VPIQICLINSVCRQLYSGRQCADARGELRLIKCTRALLCIATRT